MYGLVNQAVAELITERFGAEAWRRVRARAGVQEESFVSMGAYPDAVTYQLVGAASEELGIPANQLLEAFGEYWTLYTGAKGYGDLLRRGGRTFREFMLNLHDLHTHVLVAFPNLRPPSFWCTDVGDERLRLHYESDRPGLAPMVIGLVRGLGIMYDTDVTVVLMERAADATHEQFDVRFTPRESRA